MGLAENLLNALTVDQTTEPHIVIDQKRDILVPEVLRRIAVQYDHNIETVVFDCPRYWDDNDMSTMDIYVNYVRADKVSGCFKVYDVVVDSEDASIMHFKWKITRNVTEVPGQIKFLVSAKEVNLDGDEIYKWNSEINAQMFVSLGMEADAKTSVEITIDSVQGLMDEAEKYKQMVSSIADRSVTEVRLSNGLTQIGPSAFAYCRHLKSINLPDSITTIHANAFQMCDSLVLSSLPKSLTNIDNYAFDGCRLLTCTSLPDGITNIGANAFSSCQFELTELPPKLTSLGAGAFSYASNIKIKTLPSTLEKIYINTFLHCAGITEMTFPNSITSINAEAFSNCKNLTIINCPWAEGAVSGAPWGATNARINYDYIAP